MKSKSSIPAGLRERGQGMTEYIIIVALVAIAAIAVYAYFGQDVRGQMSSISSQLGGKSGVQGLTNAQTALNNADKEGAQT
ncbi:pilus assembly protein [Acidithiobacillus sp.]|uniref:pilus assembly protein n=1 Tax=Acidithiobacillus sp. TaxID=1872118 RepID=UPI00260B7ACF|nr:pilus assembly protein [Acidithiobacillus sp.]